MNYHRERMKMILGAEQERCDHNQEFIDSIIQAKIEATRGAFKSFAEAVMAEVQQPGRNDNEGGL